MVLASDGRPLRLTWSYSKREIIADGVVHGIGVTLGLVGSLALVVVALMVNDSWGERIAVAVYAAGLIAMLGASAAYNMWPVGRLKWWLRRVDHSVIYVMIAGTYTPLIALGNRDDAAITLLVTIWSIAALGVALKLFLPGRFDRLSIVLYLALGWSGVAAYDSVLAVLSPATLWLIAAGGGLYCIGVIFHVLERLPFQNAIWHAFVLAAAGLHYGAVLGSVLRGQA